LPDKKLTRTRSTLFDVTILITGGAGRLGYEVLRLCEEEGYKARVFDLPGVAWSHVESLGVETVKGDITDKHSVGRACEGVEAVVHLAALLPPRSESSRELTVKVNVEGTKHILEATGTHTPIILASSIAVYGVTAREEPPVKPSHPLVVHDLYSESKIMAEKLVTEAGNPYTVLRIAPIAVADLLELPDVVPYRADQRVEFVYVEDAARAIVGCLGHLGNTVHNVAGGESWRMTGADYIRRFYEALGVEVEPNFSQEPTAVDWYDSASSRPLGYQRTSFEAFEEKLRAVGEAYGLR
jgi:UDP-glucose 4-epimerase